MCDVGLIWWVSCGSDFVLSQWLDLVGLVNEGFELGKATRLDLGFWYFVENIFDVY